MRKKSLLVCLVAMMVLALVGCNRFRARSFHGEQMEQVRLPVDSAQKNDIRETSEDNSWEDEPLLEIPDMGTDLRCSPTWYHCLRDDPLYGRG